MAKEHSETLNIFNKKVEKLVDLYNSAKNREELHLVKIEQLQEQINDLKHENMVIKKQYRNCKIANRLSANNQDSNEAKKRIDKMVREIDQCISLLNE